MFSLPTYDKILISFLWFHAHYISLCRHITVTVILYIILLLENCVAFSMLGMSCLHIYGLIQNPLTAMARLQWPLLCLVLSPQYTTRMHDSPIHTPIFMSLLKNTTLSLLCYHCVWSRRILRSKTPTNMSLSFRSLSATLLTNSAANGKFKAAETKAVLSINKTKSCEF